MTYRERRERKAERLREWAGKREAKAEAAHAGERGILELIPSGQPILVGHHSEKRHRRDLERADNLRRASRDSSEKAERMREKADNIERTAAQAIYSDDADAIERLREKLAGLEAKRERMKADNAVYRKAHRAELKPMSAYQRDQVMPHPGYAIRNLGGNITRTRKRLEQAEAAAVEAGDRGAGRSLEARYPGTCAECGGDVERGDRVVYFRRTREVVCCSGE